MLAHVLPSSNYFLRLYIAMAIIRNQDNKEKSGEDIKDCNFWITIWIAAIAEVTSP